MAELKLDVTLTPKVDSSQLDAEISILKKAVGTASAALASGEGVKLKIIDEPAFKADVNEFQKDADKIKTTAESVAGAGNTATSGFKSFGSAISGALSGVQDKMKGALSPILSVFGGNLLTQGVSGLVGGFSDIIAKGKASLQVTNDMSIAFSQAGLHGADLQKAMKDTGSFASKLASDFALPVPKVREFSLTAASLTGATGKANQDLTKLAIGIQKATGGMVDGTTAIRMFGKGVTDPESEMAMARLSKQFPALGAALKGIKDPAEATKIALNHLNPTFEEMSKQASGPLGSMQRFETAIGSIKTALGKVLIEGIAPFVTSFANNIIPVIQAVVKWIGSLTEYVKPLAPLFAGIGTAAAALVGALLAIQGITMFKGWITDAMDFGKTIKKEVLPLASKLKSFSLPDFADSAKSGIKNISSLAKSMLATLMPSYFATETAGVTSFTAIAGAETAAGVAGEASGTATSAAWLTALLPFVGIAAAIAAIGVAFYALYKQSDSFKNFIDGIINYVKQIWDGVVKVLKAGFDTWLDYIEMIFTALIAPWKILFNIFSTVISTIGSIFADVVNSLFGLGDEVKNSGNIFTVIFDGIVSAIKKVGDWFNVVRDWINSGVSVIGKAFEWLMNNIFKPLAEFIISGYVVAFKVLYEILSFLGKLLWDLLVVAFTALWDLMKKFGEWISGIFIKVWDGLKSAFAAVASVFSNFGEKVGALKNILLILLGPLGAVVIAAKQLWDAFKRAGDMGTFVKAVMNGLSQVFVVFKNALSNMWEGIKSFNIKQIVSSLSGLPEQMAKAFSKGTNEYIDAANKQKAADKARGDQAKQVANQQNAANQQHIRSLHSLQDAQSLLNKLQSGEVTALQAKTKTYLPAITAAYKTEASKMSEADNKAYARTMKQINEIIKQQSKSGTVQKEKTKDILTEYNLLKENLDNQEKITQEEIAQNQLREGREKTIYDEIDANKRQLDIYEQLKQKLIDLYGIKTDEKGTLIEIQGKFSDDEKIKIKEAYAKLIADTEKSKTLEIKLARDEAQQTKTVEDSLESAQDKLDKSALEYKVKIGIEPQIKLTEFELNLLKKQYQTVQDEIKKLEDKATKDATELEKDKTQKELADKQALAIDVQNKIDDQQKKLDADTFKEKMKGVTSYAEQEKLTQIHELELTYAERLKTVRGNVAAEIAVNEELAAKRAEIEDKYRLESQSGWEVVKGNINNALMSAMTTIEFADTSEARKAAKTEIDRIKTEQNDLKKAYRNGEIAYADYVDKMNNLDKERKEQSKIANQSQIDWLKSVSVALTKTFKTMSDDAVKANAKLADGMTASYKRIGIITKMQSDLQDKDSAKYKALEAEKTKAADSATDAITAAYIQMGAAIGGTFISMLADHKSFMKALAMSALAGLKAIVPVYIAKIYSEQISELQFLGIATAAGLTAIITGLLTVAESAVNKLAFAKGGLVPGGEKMIKINELGQEFVLNHISTKKSLTALNEINTRKISIDQYAAEKYKNVNTGTSYDFSRFEHKLDIINDTIQGTARRSSQSVNVKQEVIIRDKELIKRVERKRAAFVRSW